MEQRCKHSWPGWPSLRDVITNFMGLSIIVYVGAVLWKPLTSGTTDGIQNAQAVASIVGPLLGTILGYYFGSANGERVARDATEKVEKTIEAKEDTKAISDKALEESLREVQNALRILTSMTDDPDNEGDLNEGGTNAEQEPAAG